MVGRLSNIFRTQSELALVVLLVGMLVVLFTPISAGLLDFLLLLNFSVALLVMLLTFYMDKPLSFSTFPSLLLIATLFRLSLNLAATRLILSEGDAGHVIGSIGEYVVGGNYVIGLVVFFILIVVQYVVVTNGAQRVAEVAARFTLDGMPGKQMSIDADLNMGLIDENEARERRTTIEKEANFYGAMDGASKFVKGDAIAGIIIILIDIIGGLTIGLVQLGMNWGDALYTYTLLTVGDGIVTQIPALVIATATGIIVTRAATDSHLGKELVGQITSQPRILIMLCFALMLGLLLPGIPTFPMMVLLVGFAVIAFLAYRAKGRSEDAGDSEESESKSEDEEILDMLSVDPVEISIGSGLIDFVGDESGVMMTKIGQFRTQYAKEMGMVLPKVRLVDSSKLTPNVYQFSIFGTKSGEGELYPDHYLAISPNGAKPNLPGIETTEPTYGLPAVWIEEEHRQAANQQGLTIVDPLTVMVTHFSETMRQQAHELLTRASTEQLVDRFRSAGSSLLEELIPNVLSVSDIQKVLQNLLCERVSIRNLERILEVLVDQGKVTKNPDILTEAVRQKLGASISQSVSDKEGNLHVLTMDPEVEQQLISVLKVDESGSQLLLDPIYTEKLLKSVVKHSESMLAQSHMPVIITAPAIRKHLKALTERVMPHLTVLSMAEVPNGVSLKAYSMIKV